MALTNWKKLTNTNYLGSFDLDNGNGGYNDCVLTIAKVQQEEVMSQKGKKEPCVVCYFAEPNVKPMIMNKTNCKMITKLAQTPYIEKWTGFKIQIGVKNVDAYGSRTDALRVRDIAVGNGTVEAPKCEVCGNDIQPAGGMTAEKVAEYTITKYGKRLCSTCAQAAKESKA